MLRAVPFVPQTVQRFRSLVESTKRKSQKLVWIVQYENSQLSTRAAVPIIQGPDLCTDRRAMEREKYEASVHHLTILKSTTLNDLIM